MTKRELFTRLMMPWTLVEKELYDQPVLRNEGKGEKSLRHHYCLETFVKNKNSTCDIPEHGIEVKCIECDGKFSLILPPLGRDSRIASSDWYAQLPYELYLKYRDKIGYGEVNETLFKTISREAVIEIAKPSSFIKHEFLAIVCSVGFFLIRKKYYDEAFKVIGISKNQMQTMLNEDWIYQQIEGAVSPTKIGIIPGAFKPYHKGHHALVERASKENDQVLLLVSTKARENIKWNEMLKVWEEEYKKILPANIAIEYCDNPMTSMYKRLKTADSVGDLTKEFTVYSDSVDAPDRFSDEKLKKYVSFLFKKNLIHSKSITRNETVLITGTQMRTWLKFGEKEKFIQNLPLGVDGIKIWEIFTKKSKMLKILK